MALKRAPGRAWGGDWGGVGCATITHVPPRTLHTKKNRQISPYPPRLNVYSAPHGTRTGTRRLTRETDLVVHVTPAARKMY
jgi:hypothetical protein